MEKKSKILVTGATGKSGSAAISELLKTGTSVRALVHRIDNRSKDLEEKGVEVQVGNLLNFEDISSAMKDVSRAYFCFPILTPGVLQATAYFAQAAKQEGIHAIVNMSQISARSNSKSNAALDHWVGERILDMTDIPTIHLRPTFFDDWFLYVHEDIKKNNTIILPFGNGRWAPIDSEDLGHVVAELLLNPEPYKGKILELFGPQEYDLFEISDILSGILKRKINYDPVSVKHFNEIEKVKGAHPHFIQHVTHVAQDCIDGLFSGTNNLVETILHRKPSTLEAFFTKNKSLF